MRAILKTLSFAAIAAVAAAAAALSSSTATAAPTSSAGHVDQQNPGRAPTCRWTGRGNSDAPLAQTFTAGSSSQLYAVSLLLRSAAPVRVQISINSASANNAVSTHKLTSASVVVSTTQYSWVSLNFTKMIKITKAAHYAIVMTQPSDANVYWQGDGGSTDWDGYAVGVTPSDDLCANGAYAGGQASWGPTLYPYPGDADFFFNTYVNSLRSSKP
jgi:hypothetical protein